MADAQSLPAPIFPFNQEPMAGYQFRDSDLAARRLEVLATVFSRPSADFLGEVVAEGGDLAVDLGCGPGYTTHLLAEQTKYGRIVGLDSSNHFVALAKTTETDRVSFRVHDARALPFPVGPADLLYCRFLLTHLEHLSGTIGSWATQMKPGGLLLFDEVDWIETSNPVFTTYLGIVEALLAHNANQLYVGPVLDGLECPALLRKRSSQVRQLSASHRKAATMFHLNIQTCKHQPFVRANYADERIAELESNLEKLASARIRRLTSCGDSGTLSSRDRYQNNSAARSTGRCFPPKGGVRCRYS